MLQQQLQQQQPSCSTTTAPLLDVGDVLRLAKPLERAKETSDCSTVYSEEYLYETDRVNGRVNLVRLTLLQRPATEEILGHLYVDRDFKEVGGASAAAAATATATIGGAGAAGSGASCM